MPLLGKPTYLAVLLLALAYFPSVSQADQSVRLDVGFSPDVLGASTTISVGFNVTTPNGSVPAPVTNFDLRLPKGMGLGSTTLGEAVCEPAVLELLGPTGCPANSVMGRGTALVEVQAGPEIISEPLEIGILMGPAIKHHTSMLLDAVGNSPLSAELVFHGQLLPDAGPFGAYIDTAIPITPTVPGAPDAAVVHMQATLGPRHLTYYHHVRGKLVGYQPVGMGVPEACPKGGFPFGATFTFGDGTTASAEAAVPCPRRRFIANHRQRKGTM